MLRCFIYILSFFIKKNRLEKINLNKVEKILIIKLDEIGDFVLSIPLIHEITKFYPYTSIDLLTKDNIKELANHIPYLSNKYYIKSNLFSKGKIKKIYLFLFAIVYSLFKLKQQKYNLVIVPRWDVDSSLAVVFCYFCFPEYSLTYSEHVIDRKKKYNKGYDKFYTNIIYNSDKKHEVERHIDILIYLGIKDINYKLELFLNDSDRIFVNNKIKIFDKNKILAICPAASNNRRKWAIRNYSALSKKLIDEFQFNIVVIGGNDFTNIHVFPELINNYKSKVIDFRGKLTLPQTAALLEKCLMYVGNDTGPMHLAAAVNIPIIEIVAHPETIDFFHPQSPKRFKPFGVKNIVLYPKMTKKPCPDNMCVAEDSHCINNINVEMVFEKILEFIK